MQKRGLIVLFLLIAPVLLASMAFAASCSDSDGGVNYAVKGSVTAKIPYIGFLSRFTRTVTYTDSCSWIRDKGTMLTEYSCKGDNVLRQTIACPNCKDGTCIPASIKLADGIVYYSAVSLPGGLAMQLVFLRKDGSQILARAVSAGSGSYKPYFSDWHSAVIQQFVSDKYVDISNILLNVPPVPAPTPVPINCITYMIKESSSEVISVGAKQYKIADLNVASDYVLFNINGESTDRLAEGAAKKLSDGSTVSVADILYSSREDVASYVALKICAPEAQLTCTDSDGGKNYYVKGTTIGLAADGVVTTREDSCWPENYYGDGYQYVAEWFCSYNPSDGKTYAINTNEKCLNGCSDGACIGEQITNQTIQCKESDRGINYNMAGTACLGSNCNTDVCSDNKTLVEYYIEENDAADGLCSPLTDIFKQVYACPGGCSGGACIGVPSNQTIQCRETDNGLNYNQEGKTCLGEQCVVDYCLDNKILREYYLEEEGNLGNGYCTLLTDIFPKDYTCPNGCVNGACIQVNQTCADSDKGKNLLVKGTVSVTKANGTIEKNTDVCNKDKTLKEWFCENNAAFSTNAKCSSGYYCTNGTCRKFIIGTLAGRVIDEVKSWFG